MVEDDEGQPRFLAGDLPKRDPALAQLAAAAVAGLPPAGPELRRTPFTAVLPGSDGPKLEWLSMWASRRPSRGPRPTVNVYYQGWSRMLGGLLLVAAGLAGLVHGSLLASERRRPVDLGGALLAAAALLAALAGVGRLLSDSFFSG